MIDTIKIKSDYIDETLALHIESLCRVKSCYNRSLSEIEYEFVTYTLKNTYDSSISIKVCRDEWQSVFCSDGKKITLLKPSRPYLLVECSLNKLVVGHNVYGGSDDLIAQVNYLLFVISDHFNVSLPSLDTWQVLRLDYAKIFMFDSSNDVKKYLESLNNSVYSRRKALKYNNTGCYYPGSSTTLKLYHKGSEFKKHDKKRLKMFKNDIELAKLQLIADKVLRVEVEIKKRKLDYDFKNAKVSVLQMTKNYLEKIYDDEVKKVIKVTKQDLKVVKTAEQVRDRLFTMYNSKLATTLFATWYQLTTFGEQDTKKILTESTYYRHIKQLKKAGCTWIGTDVILKDSIDSDVFEPLSCNAVFIDDKNMHKILKDFGVAI